MIPKRVKTQYIRDIYDVIGVVGLTNDALVDYNWMTEQNRVLLCGCISVAVVLKNGIDKYFEEMEQVNKESEED
ncbi:MAG: hypothetical protein PUP91_13760 [Rhizonema sp. PD37]|nr:hypothetical protein [Rhizonema sp. PD37]